MTKHESILLKYQKSGKTVSLGLSPIGIFKGVIVEFDPADGLVVLESKDEVYAGLKFACDKSQVTFLVKA